VMSLLLEIGAGTARALARRVRRVRVRVERMLGFGWLVGRWMSVGFVARSKVRDGGARVGWC
jgi:hypothetical protein